MPDEADATRLGRIVAGEAYRVGAGDRIAPDPWRLAAGWEHRFTVERTRAEEFAELYRAVGFAVLLDPVPPEALAEGCQDCQVVALMQFLTVYTRREVP